ncbi:MAG: efflux RND transporter periplasmic adaptor subunit [Opitutaceae bacterium]
MILFKRLSFYLALLGIVGITTFVLRLRAASSEPILPPPLTPPAKPFAKAIGASGLVEARRENTLVGVPVPGLVKSVKVAVWDRVQPGAPLLELDDRELRAALAAQRAQVAVTEAQIVTARATVRRLRDSMVRIERLREGSVASEEALESARNETAVAEAQVATAEAQRLAALATVTQTETLLDRLTVRAPIAGTILQVNVRAGEYVSTASTTAPLVLGDIDEVQVRADVDEQVAPRVRSGAKAVGYLKGDSVHPIAMEFVRIEPYVVPKRSLTGASTERVDTRVLQVIYRFPNAAGRSVYVGQQLDLYIEE